LGPDMLLKTPLFTGISPAELPSLLGCLGARERVYAKGEIIFFEGDPARYIGLVISGSVQIVKEDYFGNRSILAHVTPGELFAEAFSCAGFRLEVSAIAAEQCLIMLIEYQKVIMTCPTSCLFHTQLIRNMAGILAAKNIQLSRKLEHIGKKTTREKLLSYLKEQAKTASSSRFAIPFDRQELADYLGVERSAMSAELGRMKDEGLLDFNKNRFELFNA
jgi:CRP-like cAMP-binding protein